ncbi:S1 family peptidase [Bdellovibrio sp. HCB337]|uniref:S1 family peptidase n=1 Tax=Bdellovibrio sp. HCB337 TaxID=3394358 RepID=UPI0039A5BF5E
MRGSNKIASLISVSLMATMLSACTLADNFKAENFESEDTQDIVNGREIQNDNELAKSVVFIVNKVTKDVCTGSILDNNHVLTAAHCLDTEDQTNLYVFFAARPNGKTERRQVLAAKYSPYWEMRQLESYDTGDIAVIKFDGTELPVGYKPVTFLEDYSILREETPVSVLGYGLSDASDPTSVGVLRVGNLKIADPNFSSTEITLDQTKGTGVCHGDSGGPAYVYIPGKNGSKGQYLLWGVSTRGVNDDDSTCNKSVAITNASIYLTWIMLAVKTL